MACILAEMGMKQANHPLAAGQQYPKGSLVRIYGRYGVDGTPGPVTPCTAHNSDPLNPPYETTMYYLGIGTTEHPDPPRQYSPDADEMNALHGLSKHYKR